MEDYRGSGRCNVAALSTLCSIIFWKEGHCQEQLLPREAQLGETPWLCRAHEERSADVLPAFGETLIVATATQRAHTHPQSHKAAFEGEGRTRWPRSPLPMSRPPKSEVWAWESVLARGGSETVFARVAGLQLDPAVFSSRQLSRKAKCFGKELEDGWESGQKSLEDRGQTGRQSSALLSARASAM